MKDRYEDDRLLKAIEWLAAAQPPGLPPWFAEAYVRYAATRDRLEAEGVMPPDGYRPDRSTSDRIRLWRGLDHQDLKSDLRELFVGAAEWCRYESGRHPPT